MLKRAGRDTTKVLNMRLRFLAFLMRRTTLRILKARTVVTAALIFTASRK